MRVTDSTGLIDEQKINVEVLDVNEHPVIISNDSKDLAFIGVNENNSTIALMQAYDQDDDSLTFTVSGGQTEVNLILTRPQGLSFL